MTTIDKLEAWLNKRIKHAELRERDARTYSEGMAWSSRANALDDVLLKLSELKNEEDERNG
jgi:hypothetical protein